ncbi:MAG: Uncharacterized protein G01um101413_518 [Parcubacteria group bacterium Gr01-1014_13]|nr:MAG: Uncharacterized protein G01um101413_518 [Parcubacteria group bacterium Gr01-1014_13]
MVTQVIFKIDKKLKDKAMAKAQNEGIAFASVLKLATKAFVDGDFNIGLINRELSPRTKKMLAREIKDIKAGKNMSPAFNNAKDAIAYLRGL